MNNKKKKDFHCRFCDHKFTQIVGVLDKGKSKISSQVECPRCHNLLKTWESNIERNLLLMEKK